MTFYELEQKLADARRRKAVYTHLVDYLEHDFRAALGEKPRQYLLDESRQAVPEDTFEIVVTELLERTRDLEQQINTILDAEAKPKGT